MSNKTPIIAALEKEQMGKEIPPFAPGDTLVVQVRVKEGNRERLQAFEGVVIAKKNRGLNSSFTVRKISSGIGVELPDLQSSGGQPQRQAPRRCSSSQALLPAGAFRQGRAHQGKARLIRLTPIADFDLGVSSRKAATAAFFCG